MDVVYSIKLWGFKKYTDFRAKFLISGEGGMLCISGDIEKLAKPYITYFWAFNNLATD